MPTSLPRIAGALAALLYLPTAHAAVKIDPSAFDPKDIIERDVAIIGGGASGAHAAFRLVEDFGKSVVVVEKQGLLGGHVDTYIDPDTDKVIEFGLASYFPYEDALDFFKRLNVTLGDPRPVSATSRYVDFSTGKELPGFRPVDSNISDEAVRKYLAVCEENKYEEMLVPGWWNFPKGDKIPEDLLMPIGDFVKKYDMEALLPRIWGLTGGGVGSSGTFPEIITINIMKVFIPSIAKTLIGSPRYQPVNTNQELYDKIANHLGDDVLLDTKVIKSERNDNGVQLVVQQKGEDGKEKLIIAKRLLLAIQPTRENMQPFDLNDKESEIWSKPEYGHSWLMVASHSKLPEGTALVNRNASVLEDPLYSYVNAPYTTRFQHYGAPSKAYWVPVGGNDYANFDLEAARQTAQGAMERMAKEGVLPDLKGEQLVVLDSSDHGAVGFGVSADDIRGGWMADVYELQGKRSTWYTGGAVATDFTTTLWKFNDDLLPRIIDTM